MAYQISIAEAVLGINSSASIDVLNNDVTQINWKDTPVISNADILAKQVELQAIEDDKETQAAADKVSGNQKMLDLGLTQAEVDAITK